MQNKIVHETWCRCSRFYGTVFVKLFCINGSSLLAKKAKKYRFFAKWSTVIPCVCGIKWNCIWEDALEFKLKKVNCWLYANVWNSDMLKHTRVWDLSVIKWKCSITNMQRKCQCMATGLIASLLIATKSQKDHENWIWEWFFIFKWCGLLISTFLKHFVEYV